MREAGGGVTLRVRVQPRASKEGLAGLREGALVVRLSAPPVEGAANEALSRLLGRALGVPPSRVQLLRGERGRDKLVRVDGINLAAARARLEVRS
ncbi:MAG: DUF167 domain-containing protein [Vicinamibacteria bacterium]|nr:DUF167 domain-containing protein [Vicinamibacteria bacterium]